MTKQMNQVFPEDVLIPHFGEDAVLTGVEIGVSGGCGSIGMLLRLPNLTLYCIDPWEHINLQPYELGLPQEKHDQGYHEATARIGFFGKRGVIIHKRSDDAVNDVPAVVDFVFIDGHHEYTQVLRDMENYMPKVRKGGIIAGHDYIQVPDVTRAVNDVFWEYPINLGDDFVWWVNL